MNRPAPSGDFAAVVASFTRAFKRRGQGTGTLLAHKWERPDLIWPHSDVDLRCRLDRAPDSWLDYNDALAESHLETASAEPAAKRALEHPPGFAYTAAEIDTGLVRPAEAAAWTPIGNHPAPSARGSWSLDDDLYYRALLAGRWHGRYRLAADPADNIVGDATAYRSHCLVWHFLAPCAVAAHALTTRTRPTGKRAAVAALNDPAITRLADLTSDDYQSAPGPQALHEAIRAALAPLVQRALVQPLAPARTGDGFRQLAAAIALLRVRPARFRYYLEAPTPIATDYLIVREAKELAAVRTVLRRRRHLLPPRARSAAEAIAAQLPTRTDRSALAGLLKAWRADPGPFEALTTSPIPARQR